MSEIIKSVKRTNYVPYRWVYGRDLSRFFLETKNHKKLYGVRCTKCKKVLVPPVEVCGVCFAPTDKQWIPVSDHGVLNTYTVVNLSFPGQPTNPPYACGLVQLDGTDNLFSHMIGEVEFEKIKPNMRVQAVWNPEPKGDLFDIKYFKPEEK